MKLIRKLGTRLNKSGNLISYGIFLCSFDNKEVERDLSSGKRNKSCGCVQYKLSSESLKGRPLAEETKQKIKEKRKLQIITEETKQKIGKSNTGKVRTEEHKKKYSKAFKGRIISEEHRQKISETMLKNETTKGENNANWNNGSSFEPYGIEFNKELKQQILERDSYVCQFPNCTEIHDRLHVHHIDYNKKNNSPENLITLGTSCHMRTNSKKKRQYYIDFYQNIMINKLMECLL